MSNNQRIINPINNTYLAEQSTKTKNNDRQEHYLY